jgi:hypothetical protein
MHRPWPIGFVRGDDPELASYLRIEERELEVAQRPNPPESSACSVVRSM